MTDSTLIESLLYQSEGNTIDFKREQYHFPNGTDEQKSKLLKDVLAFANAWRQTDAYIVIGVEEVTGGRHNPVNITDHPDDAQLQEFINGKTNRRIEFSYEVHNYEGKKIGIIKIAKQERPIYLKKDYDKLKKNDVFIRMGSSNQVATPDDIARMGRETISSPVSPNMVLQFADHKNRQELGININLRSVAFAEPLEPLPFLEQPQTRIGIYGISGLERVNPDYWCEKETYIRINKLCQPLALVIHNQSSILAEKVRVEIKGNFSDGIYVTDDLPDKPVYEGIKMPRLRSILQQQHSMITVKHHGEQWSINLRFGDVQPKSSVWLEEPFYIGSKSLEHLEIEAVIFANNLPEPQKVNLSIDFTIMQMDELTVEDLIKWDI